MRCRTARSCCRELDTDLDEEAWRSIGGVRDAQGKVTAPPSSNHPQYAMHALLTRFGIKRGDVDILGHMAPHGRELLASEAMRPSNATAHWHRRLAEPDIVEKISGAMENLAVIAADNPEMEALAIAVAMREARHLDKSAALVTPDRALARRVVKVQEAGGAPVLVEVLLLDLEANHVGISVARLGVIDRRREAPALGMPRRHGPQQVGGKRGNPAFARQVVSDKRDGSNAGGCFHELGSTLFLS